MPFTLWVMTVVFALGIPVGLATASNLDQRGLRFPHLTWWATGIFVAIVWPVMVPLAAVVILLDDPRSRHRWPSL